MRHDLGPDRICWTKLSTTRRLFFRLNQVGVLPENDVVTGYLVAQTLWSWDSRVNRT